MPRLPTNDSKNKIGHDNMLVAHYVAVRDEVKLGAGENVDFKQYEAGMRFLLDTYIQADLVEQVADFEDMGGLDLVGRIPGEGDLGRPLTGHLSPFPCWPQVAADRRVEPDEAPA